MSNDHIKNYWEIQGNTHGASHWASWGDNWMIDLEIETIGKHIKDGDCVLDVGCANGYATFKQARARNLTSITGVDFAANMVHAALQTKNEINAGDNVNFLEGDIRKLPFPDNHFDVAYTTRVLINLPTWEQQIAGIEECIRVVKPNGLIILSEGFWEPLTLLNAMRALKGLLPLVEHDFNRYLKLSLLNEYLTGANLSFEIDDFSSIYYLGSRFLREIVTNPSDFPGFTNPINRIFFEIEKTFSGGGFGIQQAIIIKK